MLAGREDETNAFIDRVLSVGVSLSSLEKRAIDIWISSYKRYGLWDKVIAYYPFLGASMASFALNLKSSSFTLLGVNVVSGMCTINGFKPNGTNAYWDTTLIPSTGMPNNNGSLAVYSRDASLSGIDMGVASQGSTKRTLICFNQGGNMVGAVQTTLSPVGDLYVPYTGAKYVSTSRTSSSLLKIYADGTSAGNTALAASTLPTIPIYIGAVNNSGAGYFSARELCSAFIGLGFTDEEERIRFQIEQSVQKMLGRI